jgi:hypothetical protein
VPVFAAGGNSGVNLGTHMTGAEEVLIVPAGAPTPADSRAQGEAIFRVSDDGKSVDYKVIVANIENVFMAHIHTGGTSALRPSRGNPVGRRIRQCAYERRCRSWKHRPWRFPRRRDPGATRPREITRDDGAPTGSPVCQVAHKLTSSQAHKLTSSQAHKLTSSQAHKLTSSIPHSVRNAICGSTRDALRAGTQLATTETSNSATAAPPNTTGSRVPTPKS